MKISKKPDWSLYQKLKLNDLQRTRLGGIVVLKVGWVWGVILVPCVVILSVEMFMEFTICIGSSLRVVGLSKDHQNKFGDKFGLTFAC